MKHTFTKSIVAISALVMAACSQPEKTGPPLVPDGAVAGEFTTQDCIYTAREVDYAAECSVMIVPENRNTPDSRMIALPVTRVLSTGDASGEPVFWLTGGPGQSNMSLAHVSLFLDTHDVVLVGYRGVDGGRVLTCPEVGPALGNQLLSQASQDRLAQAFGACARQLQNEGVDTDGYTVIEVVDDVEAARQAIGYERINIESASYGTRLALLYDWRYPGRVHRSAMVAVNPPGHFWWDPERLDGQIRRYGELCATDDYCSSRTDDLAALMARVARDMPDHWLIFPVDGDAVLFGTFMALYQTDAAAQVFDMWIAADQGDASGFALMTAAFSFLIPADMIWGDSAAKAGSSDYDYDPGHDYVSDYTPGPTILGSPGNALGWATAAGWPVNRIAAEYREVRASSTRTLMLSGTLDVSTPYQTARDELLPFMDNAEQVVISEASHQDLYSQQRDASYHLLGHFMDTGEIDASRFVEHSISFQTSWGFPLIAKLALGVFFLGLILTFMLLRFLFGPGRRKR